jgi:uncharacterized NAD(P)/FAD-binding protein YdhS
MNLNTRQSPAHSTVAIVGGGAAGTLTAIGLLRQANCPMRIALIEPRPEPARGLAYGTRHDEHLLNVPAAKMSGFAGTPDDFLDYALACGNPDGLPRDALAKAFLPRRLYGDYLRTRLDEARAASSARLDVLRDTAVTIDRSADGWRLALASGAALATDAVVVAVGNTQRPLPARGGADLPAGRVVAAWDHDAVHGIGTDEAVAIVGSGLSMVDSVLSLERSGHRGPVHVLSRHALPPLPHAPFARLADVDVDALAALPLRGRVAFLRGQVRAAAAQSLPWQAVMEAIRPFGPRLWQTLSPNDQRRFLRHVVRHWDVHRHRIAAPVDAVVTRLRETGRLTSHRVRLRQAAMLADGRIRLESSAPDGRLLQLNVDRIVNATGVEMRVQFMGNPLLDDLLGKGLAVPGPHAIGLASAADDEGALIDADGRPQPTLRVLGSLRIGTAWESLAIPELRVQAAAAATHLLARFGQG